MDEKDSARGGLARPGRSAVNVPKAPTVPGARDQTPRQTLAELLRQGPLTLRELSQAAALPEREIYAHLEHLQRSLPRQGQRLELEPACCAHCGFVFRKRQRLKKPGRCPLCRAESIREPRYLIR